MELSGNLLKFYTNSADRVGLMNIKVTGKIIKNEILLSSADAEFTLDITDKCKSATF